MRSDLRDMLKGAIDWRQPGGALSAVGHAALLAAGVLAFSATQPFAPATESVAVDVVSEKDFNEMMKGDKASKVVAKVPERRVEKVDPVNKDNDPGAEKKDVASAEPPKAPPPAAKAPETPKPPEEPKVASITPPTRPPELRVTPPKPTPAPTPTPTPKAAEPEEDDEEDQQAELLRKKKIEEKKKLEDKKKAEDAAKAAAEEKKKLDEKLKADAEARKRIEEQKKAAEDKKKLDEKLKAEAEAEKAAEAAERKAEEKKKADAERKAKEDKAKKEQAARDAAEAEKLNNSIRQRLLASKEAPSSTGATGAALSTRSTAGNENATGKKLSPSDRAQLIGLLTSQLSKCISYSGTAPKVGPQFTFTLTRQGGLAGAVALANNSGESNFRPFAEAAMRAVRNCQPYNIPARFLDSYEDWKNVRLNLDTSDMQ